jgi:ribonuclease BN (tRNA processing enzyme)
VAQVGKDFLMFDCGPAATHKLVKAGLFPTQIDYLFFTHHHYDHNADYACFLLTRWNHHTGQENKLQVWGPPPLERITKLLVGDGGAFYEDWNARVSHPASQAVHVERGGKLPRPKPDFDVSDIESGEVIEGDRWRVTTAYAQHAQPWLQSLAYRVDSDAGSIVITGDAVSCKPLAELSRGVDTFVVNVWDHQDYMQEAGIAGTLAAARMAQAAGAKRLVTAHSLDALTRPGSKEKGIVDIGRLFDGQIIFGEELMILDL